MLFSIGDYLAGMLIGVATTLAVRGIVSPGMDMVLAMLVGMAAGTVVHLLLGLVLHLSSGCSRRWCRDR